MAALQRWVAGMTRKAQPRPPFPPSIYPKMLKKVEGIKKIGAPTEDTSKVLEGIEDKLKTYSKLWEANKRQVRGLLRHSMKCRVLIAVTTVSSAAGLAKGAHVAYKLVDV